MSYKHPKIHKLNFSSFIFYMVPYKNSLLFYFTQKVPFFTRKTLYSASIIEDNGLQINSSGSTNVPVAFRSFFHDIYTIVTNISLSIKDGIVYQIYWDGGAYKEVNPSCNTAFWEVCQGADDYSFVFGWCRKRNIH